MSAAPSQQRNPWSWIPTLYLAQGLPYTMVMVVSVIMYKRLGISNADIALYTSWLYLPWVIKPLWSPVVDLLKTRRLWIWVMQLVIGAGLAGVALTIPAPDYFQWTLAFFWLLAFSSATHDIGADGFYMLALTEKQQAFFVGVRSTFFRIALIAGQGLLVIVAGIIERNTGLTPVEVSVVSKAEAAHVERFDPGFARLLDQGDGLRLFVTDATVEIRPEPRTRKETDELIAQAKEHNTQKGFYGTKQADSEPERTGSRWSRFVLIPVKATFDAAAQVISWPFQAVGKALAPILREHFGPETKVKADVAGNIGFALVHLSKPPGKEIVMTVTQKSGGFPGFFTTANKSFSVAEGTRLVFDDGNWSVPAVVVFQLDPKLRDELAVSFEFRSGNIPLAWSITVGILAFLFLLFCVYHGFVLPRPLADKPGAGHSLAQFFKEFFRTFGSYFRKERIGFMLAFLLFYRFAEAQLVKMAAPFMLDTREVGGLALTTGQVGFVYGTVGVIALTLGGLLGGFVAARHGLKYWLWWMVMAINLPNAVYVYLAYALPDNFWIINLCVAIEQFGYGFGFAAYLLYMIYIAQGEHRTAHYAICTGFMALGMMLPGMFSGWLQEIIGYRHFFVWVMLATIPGFVAVKLIPLKSEFGRNDQVP